METSLTRVALTARLMNTESVLVKKRLILQLPVTSWLLFFQGFGHFRLKPVVFSDILGNLNRTQY